MKSKTLITLLALAVLVTSGGVGCRKKPTPLTEIPGKGMTGPRDTGANPPRDVGPGTAVVDQGPTTKPVTVEPDKQGFPPSEKDFDKWTPDSQRFAGETVHFDFDKAIVRPDDLPKIRTVADAMKSMPGKAVRVEGHCDERGTEEYNRSLGERRALAVREELIKLGVDATMIPHVTYGEERPVDPGHNEAAWAKNRRAEFILLSPPGSP